MDPSGWHTTAAHRCSAERKRANGIDSGIALFLNRIPRAGSSFHRAMFQTSPTFKPYSAYRGGHVQTVMGALLPSGVAETSTRPDLTRVALPLSGGDQLEAFFARSRNWRTVLLAHGLGGSVDSPYLCQAVDALLRSGCGVLAIQQRGSGGLLERTTRPYMTGHTDDIAAAIRWLRLAQPGVDLLAIGFSISGNTLLKHLGNGRGDLPDAAIAVAPPVDLDGCSRDLLRMRSRAFDLWILRHCRRWIPSLRGEFAGPVRVPPWGSLRAFDERYITPVWGFDSLEHYYRSASAIHYVGEIETPTLVVHATDDPVVDARHLRRAPWSSAVRVDRIPGGGHLGFLERDVHGGRSPWLARTLAHHALSFGPSSRPNHLKSLSPVHAEMPCAAR